MDVRLSNDALVLVGDGEKALFLRNRGTPFKPELVVEQILENDNPKTADQGTDQPGRASASPGTVRSAVEETDWHRISKERFASDIAAALYKQAHAGRFDELVVIAPPLVLGTLRKQFHKEVAGRVTAELPKELASLPIAEIEKLLAA